MKPRFSVCKVILIPEEESIIRGLTNRSYIHPTAIFRRTNPSAISVPPFLQLLGKFVNPSLRNRSLQNGTLIDHARPRKRFPSAPDFTSLRKPHHENTLASATCIKPTLLASNASLLQSLAFPSIGSFSRFRHHTNTQHQERVGKNERNKNTQPHRKAK